MAYSLKMADSKIISDIAQYLTAFRIFELQPVLKVLIILILTIAVVLSLILLIIGGIQWSTSGGDKEKITSARGRIIAAIIGLLIVFLAWAIYGVLGGAFRFPSVFQIPGGPSPAGRCQKADGTPGETCNNLNKCDIAGGCNPACCASAVDCPSGQYCSIPNGYCQSGKSCAGTILYHKECRNQICVNVPGEGSDQCQYHWQCQ